MMVCDSSLIASDLDGKRRASGIRCVHLAKPQRFHKRATHGSLPIQYVAQIRALDAVPSGKGADTSFLLDCCFDNRTMSLSSNTSIRLPRFPWVSNAEKSALSVIGVFRGTTANRVFQTSFLR